MISVRNFATAFQIIVMSGVIAMLIGGVHVVTVASAALGQFLYPVLRFDLLRKRQQLLILSNLIKQLRSDFDGFLNTLLPILDFFLNVV